MAPTNGIGSPEDPFMIGNAEELLWLSNYVDSIAETKSVYAELIADIEMSSVCGIDKGSWKPIGKPKKAFSGSFEGNGHSISNLYVKANDTYNGLFGVARNAHISNLTIASGSVTSTDYSLGAIAGNAGNSVIENCHNYASVKSNRFVGGIVGFMSPGTVIKHCHNEGSISSGNDWGCGGIVGGSDDGLVTNCYNLGTLTGESRVGGILGDFQGPSAITNCYSIGDVKCSKLSGPVVGYTDESSSSSVLKNNYYNASSSANKKAQYATLEQFKSGEITYLLNAGQDTLVWYQNLNIDEYPVFDPSHGIVKYDSVKNVYSNVYSDIDEILANEAANVYVVNRTVYVEGAKSFKIFDILGVNVTNLNGNLSNGIYAVLADGKSYKVIVK